MEAAILGGAGKPKRELGGLGRPSTSMHSSWEEPRRLV